MKIFIHLITYGSASKVGRAVSCIFEGALNPIAYTPFKSSGFLNKFKKIFIGL